METTTVHFVRSMGADFQGRAVLYRLDEPIAWSDYRDSGTTHYVIVSSLPKGINMLAHWDTTAAFPANGDGDVLSWKDLITLDGLDHDPVLAHVLTLTAE